MRSFSIIRLLNVQRCQQLQLCLFTHLGEAPLGHVLFSKPRRSLTKAMQQNQLWPLRCWPPHCLLALCHLPVPNRRLCYTLRTRALCSVCAASCKMAPCPVPGAAACGDSAGTQRLCAALRGSRAGAVCFKRRSAVLHMDTGSASWLCLGRTGRVRREVSKQNTTKRSVRSAQLGLHGILGSTASQSYHKKAPSKGRAAQAGTNTPPLSRRPCPGLSLSAGGPSTHWRRPGPAARTAALCPAAASAPRPAPGLCQPSAAAPAPVSPDNGRGPPRRPAEPLSGTGTGTGTAAPRSSRRAASPLPSAAPSSPRGAPAPPPPGPQSPSPGARQPRTCRRARPAGRRGLRAAAGWRRGDTWGRRGQRRRQEFPRQLEVAAVAPPPRVPVRGERPPRSSLLTNTQRAAPGPGRGRVWRRHGRQEEPDQVGQRRRLPGARSGARGRRRWRPGGPAAGGAPRAAPRAVCLRRPKRQPKPSSDEGYWDCSVCTFRNSAEAFKCMMCDVRKGTSTRWVPARGPRFARRRPWQRRGRVRRGGPGRARGVPSPQLTVPRAEPRRPTRTCSLRTVRRRTVTHLVRAPPEVPRGVAPGERGLSTASGSAGRGERS